MSKFRFRLEKVLDHRSRHEEMVRQELASAIAAVVAQQERAVEAQRRVDDEVAGFRALVSGPIALRDLRAKHQDLLLAHGRAAHEESVVGQMEGESVVGQLEGVADDRGADLVRAGQDREALVRLRRNAEERHRADLARVEANTLDELALRRAGRGPGRAPRRAASSSSARSSAA